MKALDIPSLQTDGYMLPHGSQDGLWSPGAGVSLISGGTEELMKSSG